MNVLNLLSVNSYIIVNRELVTEIGLEEAVMFGALCSEYNYWLMNNRLHYGMFYCTIEKLQAMTGLSYYKQTKAITNLVNRKLITTVVDGMPATRYFQINENQVLKLLHISFQENSKLDLEGVKASNNRNINRESNNRNIEKENIDQHIETINESADEKVPVAENTLVQVYGREKSDDSIEHENDALKDIQSALNKVDASATSANKEKAKKQKSSKSEDDDTDYGLPSNNPIADRIYKDFLGSAKAPTATQLKKANRFTKCVMAIDDFIDPTQEGSRDIKDLLVQYLNMRFEDREAQIYVNQWRGMLSKLLNIVAQDNCDIREVIQQSIERGWKNFYPINQRFKNKGKVGSVESYDARHENANYNYDSDQELIEDINRNNGKDQKMSDTIY